MMLSEVISVLNDPLVIAAAAFGLVFSHFLAAEVDDGF